MWNRFEKLLCVAGWTIQVPSPRPRINSYAMWVKCQKPASDVNHFLNQRNNSCQRAIRKCLHIIAGLLFTTWICFCAYSGLRAWLNGILFSTYSFLQLLFSVLRSVQTSFMKHYIRLLVWNGWLSKCRYLVKHQATPGSLDFAPTFNYIFYTGYKQSFRQVCVPPLYYLFSDPIIHYRATVGHAQYCLCQFQKCI